jgi:DNA polymerase III subunit gamma/tau
MGLYQKYRPTEFSQVVGMAEVVKSVEALLEKSDKPHSYLLTGSTGCGKTTLARIMASKLSAEEISIMEVDSADFRGIDTVRDIRKIAQYRSLSGGNKVWIIDEVHKMTNDAQNALLKTLEDPPSHVFFILCTTDPQKLIATIKGRCVTFQVRTLNDREMFRVLRRIVSAEGASLSQEIYDQIIQDAQGHPRNAINVLEQVLVAPVDKRMDIAKKKAEEQSEAIELCRALIGRKGWREVSRILEGLRVQEPESIRRTVLGYCQAILLKSDNTQAGLVMEEFMDSSIIYGAGFPGLVYICYSIVKNG